jgi:hypothetical protein
MPPKYWHIIFSAKVVDALKNNSAPPYADFEDQLMTANKWSQHVTTPFIPKTSGLNNVYEDSRIQALSGHVLKIDQNSKARAKTCMKLFKNLSALFGKLRFS